EPALLPHIVKGFDYPPLESLGGVAKLIGPADLDPLDGAMDPELFHRLNLLLATPGALRVLHLHLSNARNAASGARLLAHALDRSVVLLDLRAIAEDHDEKVAIALREARLRNGLPLFLNPMALAPDEEPSSALVRQHAQQWRRMLAHESGLVLLGSEEPDTRDVDTLPSMGFDLSVHTFAGIGLHRRRDMFDVALKEICNNQPGGLVPLALAPDVSPEQLAAVYRVDEVEVRSIVGQAAADVR